MAKNALKKALADRRQQDPEEPKQEQTEELPSAPVANSTGANPRYQLAKRYSPKTERNTETWDRLTAALADGPKTIAELQKVVENHKDFVGYMVRGGHLAPVANG